MLNFTLVTASGYFSSNQKDQDEASIRAKLFQAVWSGESYGFFRDSRLVSHRGLPPGVVWDDLGPDLGIRGVWWDWLVELRVTAWEDYLLMDSEQGERPC